uniref:Uncharacterized protein n=1 Tax=Alexandrium monilatum TaxID=311494 RepID=A0A7S4UYX7_9DINO
MAGASPSQQAQDLGRAAREPWILTYDHRLWGPMLTTHLAMMEEDLMLGTLDKIPRKLGVSKEALRDRSLLPEGNQATTNWWKSAQVAPRPRSTIEVPGVTDRRFVGPLPGAQEPLWQGRLPQELPGRGLQGWRRRFLQGGLQKGASA